MVVSSFAGEITRYTLIEKQEHRRFHAIVKCLNFLREKFVRTSISLNREALDIREIRNHQVMKGGMKDV